MSKKAREFDNVPLRMLKKSMKQYPRVWKDIDEARKTVKEKRDRGEDVSFWPEEVFAPIGLVSTSISNNYGVSALIAVKEASHISMLAAWRISKEIFVFDPDMEEELYNTDSDGVLPTEILCRLPYHCFYVQTKRLECMGQSIQGFFVSHDCEGKTGELELRFTFVLEDGEMLDMILGLSEPTIEKSMQKLIYEEQKKLDAAVRLGMMPHVDLSSQMLAIDVITNALQLVLYIISANSDTSLSPTKKVQRTAAIKDRYLEVREWNVGTRLGAQFRVAKRRDSGKGNSYTPVDHGSSVGARKRPHIRRGHWHHYWTGKKQTPERKLILKWLPPTTINVTDEFSQPSVIHEVTQ